MDWASVTVVGQHYLFRSLFFLESPSLEKLERVCKTHNCSDSARAEAVASSVRCRRMERTEATKQCIHPQFL
jgi:hypothetical protein